MNTWPPEPDDGLVGRPVPVVLEAAAVELDHPLDVVLRPEDVVVEEPVAVVRGLLGDLRAADRAVPDERRHAVQRARRRREARQRRAEPAFPIDDILAPQAVQEGVVLDRERDPVPDVLAEPRVDRAHVAAAHHQVDPAAGEMLEHRVVLGDLHRVVRGDQGRGRRQDEPLRLRRDVAEHRGGGGGDERRIVVLAGREHVEADLLRLEGDGDHGLDALFLARRSTGDGIGRDIADREDSELHVNSDVGLTAPSYTTDGCLSNYLRRRGRGRRRGSRRVRPRRRGRRPRATRGLRRSGPNRGRGP